MTGNVPKTDVTQAASDPRLLKLTTLLQLQHEVRHVSTMIEFHFVVVNETHRVIPYQQAIFAVSATRTAPRLMAVSGVSELDKQSPFVLWMERLLKSLFSSREMDSQQLFTIDDVPEKFHEGWDEWMPDRVAWIPLLTPGKEHIGGLWLARDEEFDQSELTLAERAADAYGHSWTALRNNGMKSIRRSPFSRAFKKIFRYSILAALIGALFIPVRLSVLAPADVVPIDPLIIAAPIEGVIETIYVKPNQPVQQGDLLFSLDDTTLASRHDVASKSLAVAEADFLRAEQKAFSDAQSKAELAVRTAVVEQKRAELEYTAQLLERINVRASQSGIAVFSDTNELLGKPVAVGEKVMTVADPNHTELVAWVPVEDAINLDPGSEIDLFLNIDPTQPLKAVQYQASYEAQVNSTGILAFQVRGHFNNSEVVPRIGLKGTAKLYSEKVPLAYYIFRKPLVALRQYTGL